MDRLARLLPEDGFDWYVAIARGGLVPACLLAQITGQDQIDTLCARSYVGMSKEQMSLAPKSYAHLEGLRVLVIDDLCDSGETMEAALAHLRRFSPAEIKTAALFVKQGSRFRPDYFIEERPAEKWIVFPWEADQCLTIS